MAIVTIFSVIFMLMPIGIMSSSKWLATNEGFKNYNVHLNASSMPVIFGSKQLVPSNTRTVNLFSRTGRFLKITQNGKVRGDINTHSRDSKLWNINLRRVCWTRSMKSGQKWFSTLKLGAVTVWSEAKDDVSHHTIPSNFCFKRENTLY